jgi:hypothetical protein
LGPTRKGQELRGQLAGALGAVADRVQIGHGARRARFDEQLERAQHGRQQIVEVMGQTACQAPDALQALRLA